MCDHYYVPVKNPVTGATARRCIKCGEVMR